MIEMEENHSASNMPTSAWQGAPQEETFQRTMWEGSFMNQFQALIYRNLTIKKRDKRKSLTELIMPLYWILILAIIRISIGDTVLYPVVTPHGQDYLMNSTFALENEDILVAPNTVQVKRVMENVQSIAEELDSPLYANYFKTEEELVKEFSKNKTSIKYAVIFPDDPSVNKSYTLRFNPTLAYIPSSQLWSRGEECRTQNPDNSLQAFHCAPNSYYFSGFSALQTIIDMALINQTSTSGMKIEVPEILLENFPRGQFESGGAMSLRNIVPLYMVFAWGQFIVYMMMLVVEEKEKKLKESMKMMGLRDSVYWLSWFTVYAMYVLLLSVVCIILLPLATVFQKANLFLLFILFILYGSSSIMFGFMLTPFFNKAKVAGIVSNLVMISFSLLFYLQVYLEDEVDPGLFWGLAIFSPCAFAFAIDKVIYFDFAADGINFASIWDGPGLPFAGSLIMISVDILLYLFLAYYLDNVIPSEYGTKRKPWFIFQKSFWIRDHNKFHKLTSEGVANSAYMDDLPANPDIEPVSAEVQARTAVHIKNLEKTFSPKGKKPVKAVDGFSLDIYEGQITAILGHNGAGKTTLFNILTGMTAPSSGSATIFGMDINNINDLTDIHRITGICPQHDVVFLMLTPREHLRFFARIRGVPGNLIEREVEQALKEVFLTEKGDTKAADLSGGQKRKLSIAIALIGDPKIIFLDEPTAGVDAYSRRKLWTLLKSRKQGKVILLTTHFMDEADILADRKAIMSKGKLRCCGTSLFLKNKFGLGYHLTLIVEENSEEETIKKTLQKNIPKVQLARYFGKEMSFILPSDSSPCFPSLFKQLDQSITNATEGIEGYGVSMTTLEEVFLALNDESEEGELGSMDNVGQQMIREKSSSASPIHSSSPVQENGTTQANFSAPNQGFAIESVDVQKDDWRAFVALLKARVTGLIREPAAVIFMILFPLAFTIASIALADSQSIQISTNDASTLPLIPEIYKPDFYGALLYNDTTHKLDSLVSTLTAAGMAVDSYSGNYSELVEEQNYMGAFDVKSFPILKSLKDTSVRLRFNDSYMHSIPILVNLLNNAFMNSIAQADPIQVFSHPLPVTTESIEFDVSSFIAPMMIGFAFTLIPAGLTIDLVHDREIKARYMLRLNGVGFHTYFSSYLLMMIALYMVSYIGLLIIIAAFGVKSLIIGPAFGAVAVLYFLYMPAAILASAVISYLFDKSETARQFYPSIVTTLGFVTYTAVSLIDMLVQSNGINSAQILHIVLTIICPPYIPFGLMYYINKVYIMCSVSSECGNLTVEDYMTPEIIVLFVVTIISIPIWYLLLRVADTVKLGGSWRTALWMDTKNKAVSSSQLEARGEPEAEGEDEDVKQERKNVHTALMENSSSSPVLIYDLGKLYKKKEDGSNPCKKDKEEELFPALKSVSFEVKASQVFGLLGPNGAGKTTTLSIMTAEETPSWGRVQICGEDIQSSLSAVFETMGYCPQHDALWSNITVAEHITTYAEIRGIRKDQMELLVDTYVKGLEIDEHRNKKSKDCSGGTKRKLSYILSMLGRPRVVLLDEPSTGMDPKSKRFLWNSILSSFRDERSAILTTHSMEEADALCSSIGILVRGSMRCIGPIQHLKNKYGGGYTLEVKVQKERAVPPVTLASADSSPHHNTSPGEQQSSSMIEKVKAVVQETFPNAILDEQFDERLMYKVPQTDVTSLALIFEILEKVKNDGFIDEYALSQTTLEQVFLQFARQQEENEEEAEKEGSASHL